MIAKVELMMDVGACLLGLIISAVMTLSSSTSTTVSNVVTPFASCPKQDDKELWNACWTVCNVVPHTQTEQDDEALWNMWASAMLYPPDMPEEEKKSQVQMLLKIGRDRAGAIKYVKNVKQTLQADLPQMGMRYLSTSLFLVLTIPVIADSMAQGRHFVQDCRI
jgi:hypothetical protein